jgi:dynein heavy chain, axonemal
LQKGVVGDVNFLRILLQFSEQQRDSLNDETVELLAPYLELDDFDLAAVRNASRAGTMCSFLFCHNPC